MSIQYLSGITQATSSYVGEPTGFKTRDTTTLSFDVGTRTFTISAVVSRFEIFFAGVIHTVTGSASVQLPNTTGSYYVYFDADTKQLTSYQLVGNGIDAVSVLSILKRHVVVGMVYWDATAGKAVLVADERHGVTMDGDTHAHLHVSFGAQWTSGLALTNIIVDGNGTSNSHAQFGVANGVIRDEDLRIVITDGLPQDISPTVSLPTIYRIGSGWKITQSKTYPFVLSGEDPSYTGTLPAYNYEVSAGVWALAEVTTNRYLLTHILATNDIRYPIIAVVGGTYSTITNARSAALTEMMGFTGLPFPEFVPLGTLIAQCSTSYTNTPKAIFRSTSDGGSYIDWRSSRSFSSATGSSTTPAMISAQVSTTSPYVTTNTDTTVPGLSTTIPLAGTYIVTYSVAAEGSGGTLSANKLYIGVTVNGVPSSTHARVINVIGEQAIHVGTLITLAVNDTIAVTARSVNTTGALTISSGSILSYIRLG